MKNAGKKNTKIKYRIMRLSLISVAVCLSTMALTASLLLTLTAKTTAFKTANALASAYSASITHTFNTMEHELSNIAQDTSLYDESRPLADRKADLQELATSRQFRDLSIANADGTTYNDTDISERDYFKAGKFSISAPVIRKTDGSITTMLGIPMTDGQHVLYGSIDNSALSGGLLNESLKEGGQVYILDKNSAVVASSDADAINNLMKFSEEPSKAELWAQIQADGGTGEFEYTDGQMFLAVYKKMPVCDWTIVVTDNRSILLGELNGYIITLIVMVAVLGILAMCTSLPIAKGIARPIELAIARLRKLAAGDLTSEVAIEEKADETKLLAEALEQTRDELSSTVHGIEVVLGRIAQGELTDCDEVKAEHYVGDFERIGTAMQKILEDLRKVFGNIATSVDSVQAGSEQVAAGASNLSENAVKESAAIDEIAGGLHELNDTAAKSASAAADVSGLTKQAFDEAEHGQRVMQTVTTAITEIKEKANAISEITKAIGDIAFQTNILALNASIEAARAGEHGKGFSVVADEVRNLAAKSSEAAEETQQLLSSVVTAIDNGVALATDADDAIKQIVAGVQSIATEMETIAESAEAQKTSVASITDSMKLVESNLQATTATAEESAAASHELTGLTTTLHHEMAQFKF